RARRADRNAGRRLWQPRDDVRRELHRLAADEPGARNPRRRRPLAGDRRRPADRVAGGDAAIRRTRPAARRPARAPVPVRNGISDRRRDGRGAGRRDADPWQGRSGGRDRPPARWRASGLRRDDETGIRREPGALVRSGNRQAHRTVKHDDSAWPFPRFVAHRGGGWLAPENTLAAMRVGYAHGYRMVEIDVRLSGDGTLV